MPPSAIVIVRVELPYTVPSSISCTSLLRSEATNRERRDETMGGSIFPYVLGILAGMTMLWFDVLGAYH